MPAPEPIDILAEFDTGEKPPVPIRMGSIEADVRRGFSGEEVVTFHRLALEMKFDQVLDLITTNGPGLWEYIEQQTADYASKILNKIINVAELHEGNMLAPLQGFVPDPAGARPSPESSATTE